MKHPAPPPRLIAVLTTTATRDEALRIAEALVQQRLVACVQISQIESVYRWQGEVQHEPECRLLCKTTAAQYPQLEAAIRALHPYELPAIFALPVEQAFGPYADWVQDAISATGQEG